MDGRQMEDYLRKHPTVLYRYRPNTPGLVVVLFMAISAGGFSIVTLLTDDMGSIWYWGAGIALAIGVFLLGVVLYWAYYTHVHYVATSDRHLIMGVGTQVIAIAWKKLDAASFGFDRLDDEDGQIRGVLPICLEDHTCKLRLFSRYVVLDNLHAFIATMLTRMTEAAEPKKRKKKGA